jgi:hypothetical protein
MTPLLVLLAVATAGLGAPSNTTPEEPSGDSQPASLAGWKARHQREGTTPEAALKIWFDALFLYMEPATRDLGRQVLQHLTLPLRDRADWDRLPSNRTFSDRLKDPAYGHIFRSYAEGTSPDNGYRMEPTDYRLGLAGSERDRYGRGWRLLLVSSGADNPRPVYLKKSTSSGLWYVDGFANVYVGVRPPRGPDEERFE